MDRSGLLAHVNHLADATWCINLRSKQRFILFLPRLRCSGHRNVHTLMLTLADRHGKDAIGGKVCDADHAG